MDERTDVSVGQWVIHAGKVKVVTRVEGGIVGVTDGTLATGGHLVVFPLTLPNKLYGDAVMSWHAHATSNGGVGLNYPDIARAFEALHDECLAISEANEEERGLVLARAKDLAQEIIAARRSTESVSVDGVRIFRRI